MDYFLGVDSGAKGGWAILDKEGNYFIGAAYSSFKQFRDQLLFLSPNFNTRIFAVLEQVWGRPGQNTKATFNQGHNYGGWQATFELLEFPVELISAVKWQKNVLGNFPKGKSKEASLAFATRRWPQLNLKKKDDGLTDALCIAYYARRLHLGKEI